MTETGWFSDVDEEADEPWIWQPCLQVHPGLCHSFEAWHKTQEDCDRYIRDEILPASANGLLDG